MDHLNSFLMKNYPNPQLKNDAQKKQNKGGYQRSALYGSMHALHAPLLLCYKAHASQQIKHMLFKDK